MKKIGVAAGPPVMLILGVMKDEIRLPAKFVRLLMIVAATFFISVSVYLIGNYVSYQRHVRKLVQQEIKGRIVYLKDLRRGSFAVHVQMEDTVVKMTGLPLAWHVDKYNISIGDSIYKSANAKNLIFYRDSAGDFIQYCSFALMRH